LLSNADKPIRVSYSLEDFIMSFEGLDVVNKFDFQSQLCYISYSSKNPQLLNLWSSDEAVKLQMQIGSRTQAKELCEELKLACLTRTDIKKFYSMNGCVVKFPSRAKIFSATNILEKTPASLVFVRQDSETSLKRLLEIRAAADCRLTPQNKQTFQASHRLCIVYDHLAGSLLLKNIQKYGRFLNAKTCSLLYKFISKLSELQDEHDLSLSTINSSLLWLRDGECPALFNMDPDNLISSKDSHSKRLMFELGILAAEMLIGEPMNYEHPVSESTKATLREIVLNKLKFARCEAELMDFVKQMILEEPNYERFDQMLSHPWFAK